MANVFDQFDQPAQAAQNPFDQFDEPNTTVVGKTAAVSAPTKTPSSFKSEPSYAGNDPYEGMPWYLSRNNTFGRFSNMVEHGATMGLNTEVKPLADMAVAKGRQLLGYGTPSKTTVGDLAAGKEAAPAPSPSDVYHASKQTELAKHQAAREEFGPYVSTAAEILGGFGGIGSGAGIGQAATRAPGIWNAAKGYFGGIGNSAKVGAGLGAVQGATSGDGTLGERLANTAEGAAVGAGTAGAIQGIGVPLLRGAIATGRYAGKAVSNALNPKQAAIEALADRGVEDNIDYVALQREFSPQPSGHLVKRGFTQDDMADIVSRKMNGETADALAREYGLHPDTVRDYTNNYQNDNPTPLNVLEMARIKGGPGTAQNTADFARANANMYPQPEMIRRLMRRQAEQPERIRGIIEDIAPGSKLEDTQAHLEKAMSDEAQQKFSDLHAQPDVPVTKDLGELLANPLVRPQWEETRLLASTDPKDPFELPSYEEIAKTFGVRPKGGQGLDKNGVQRPAEQYPYPSGAEPAVLIPAKALDYFDRALRMNADAAFATENGGTRGTVLNNLRQRLLETLDPANPSPAQPTLVEGFRDAKTSYARANALVDALKSGAKMKPELGQSQRDTLSGLEDMSPQEQELFRIGQARHLQDMLSSSKASKGGMAANRYSTEGVRQTINSVFEPADAATLNRHLANENVTTQSVGDLFGNSTTAKQILNQNRIMQGAQMGADVAMGRLHKIWEWASLKLGDQIGKRAAAEVLRMVSETDPVQVLPILRDLAKAAQTSQERQVLMELAQQYRPLMPLLAGKYAAEQSTAAPDEANAPQGALPKPALRLLPPGYSPRAALGEAQQKLARNPGSQRVRDAVTRRLMEHGLTLEHDPASLLAAPNRPAAH